MQRVHPSGGSTPGASSDNRASATPSTTPPSRASSSGTRELARRVPERHRRPGGRLASGRRGPPTGAPRPGGPVGCSPSVRVAAHEAGAAGPGGLGAHRLGEPALRLLAGGHGHHRPPGFITRATVSMARLAVDFTVPREIPVASAISDSLSPP